MGLCQPTNHVNLLVYPIEQTAVCTGREEFKHYNPTFVYCQELATVCLQGPDHVGTRVQSTRLGVSHRIFLNSVKDKNHRIQPKPLLYFVKEHSRFAPPSA